MNISHDFSEIIAQQPYPHAHHYLGFAKTQWRLFEKEQPRRVKPLLYVYRVLLTGIYLMRTGRIEANLAHLNTEFKLPHEALRVGIVGLHKTMTKRGLFASFTAKHVNVIK